MWDFNWGVFWAVVAYGASEVRGQTGHLGFMVLVLARRATTVCTASTAYSCEKWGWGDRGTPRRPAPSKPVLANDSVHTEEGVDNERDTRTGVVVLAAEEKPENSSCGNAAD